MLIFSMPSCYCAWHHKNLVGRAISGYLFKTLILLVNNIYSYIRICAIALTTPKLKGGRSQSWLTHSRVLHYPCPTASVCHPDWMSGCSGHLERKTHWSPALRRRGDKIIFSVNMVIVEVDGGRGGGALRPTVSQNSLPNLMSYLLTFPSTELKWSKTTFILADCSWHWPSQ